MVFKCGTFSDPNSTQNCKVFGQTDNMPAVYDFVNGPADNGPGNKVFGLTYMDLLLKDWMLSL